MSDQPGAGSLPELTPEQEGDVRRMLAQARHDEPIPAEVAARLDDVLAGLGRDEPATPGVAPVLDLASRRRRRNAAALLAGAAAVIVGGFLVGQVIDVGDTAGSDAGGSAAEPADRGQADTSGDGAASGLGESDETRQSPDESSSPGAPSVAPGPSAATLPAPLQLSSRSLARDVRTQLRRQEGVAALDAAPEDFAAYGCAVPDPTTYGLGQLYPALFDGTPAVLAVRPASGGTREAEVLACGSADQLAKVTIPDP